MNNPSEARARGPGGDPGEDAWLAEEAAEVEKLRQGARLSILLEPAEVRHMNEIPDVEADAQVWKDKADPRFTPAAVDFAGFQAVNEPAAGPPGWPGVIPASWQGEASWVTVTPGSKAPDTRGTGKWAVGSFTDATAYAEKRNRGLGFIFNPRSEHFGIDLDACFLEDGTLKAWAVPLLEPFRGATYMERSRSGRGLHIVGKGRLPVPPSPGKTKMEGEESKAGVEVYAGCRNHHLALTGDVWEGQGAITGDATPALAALVARLGVKPEGADLGPEGPPPEVPDLTPERTAEVRKALLGNGPPDEVELLDHGEGPVDRSAAVMKMLVRGIGAGVTTAEAFAFAKESAGLTEYALAHREGNGTKAERFLWREVERAAREVEKDRVNPAAEFEPYKAPEGEAEEVKPLRLMSARDLLAKNIPPQQYAIRPFFPKNEITEIHGGHGIFKSTGALYACLAVATGRSWDGSGFVEKGRALFYTKEDGEGLIQKRIKAWLTGIPPAEREAAERDVGENLVLVTREHSEDLHLTKMDARAARRVEKDIARLRAAMEGCVLVVVETASRLHGGMEDNESLAVFGGAMESFIHPSRAVVYVRHTAKEHAREGRLDSYGGRGGTSLSDMGRSVISVSRTVPPRKRGATAEDEIDRVDPLAPVIFLQTKGTHTGPGAVVVFQPVKLTLDGDDAVRLEPVNRAAAAEEREKRAMEKQEAAFPAAVERLWEEIAAAGAEGLARGDMTKSGLAGLPKGIRAGTVGAALDLLEREKRIRVERRKTGKSGPASAWCVAEERGTPGTPGNSR